MLIFVATLVTVIVLELAVAIWLLLRILDELEELEHRHKPPHAFPQAQPHFL